MVQDNSAFSAFSAVDYTRRKRVGAQCDMSIAGGTPGRRFF